MTEGRRDVAAAFRRVADAFPDRPALIWGPNSRVTFAELDRLSNRLARAMRSRGVRKGDRVCVRLDKTTFTYALLVACVKSGAPYFVVDPANPAPRTAHMLAKCRPALVFSAAEAPLAPTDAPVVEIARDEPFRPFADVSDAPFETPRDLVATDPAYVMFTSGSTGFPKGAVMSHANLLNFIAWGRDEFGAGPGEVFSNVNPLYFDNSVFDVYAGMFNGAALAPFDAATIKDPWRVVERVDETGCTVWFSVPSMLIWLQTLRLVTPEALRSVRTVVFGGEGYPKVKLKELFDCFRSRMRIVNVYGPTECTCICSAYDVTAADFEDMDGYPPLGSLTRDFSYVVLDEDREVARGEIGELCLGGPCVGLGYFDEPELTRKAFVQNPLNASFHERLYRTGDLVRVAQDGKIWFVGRRDSQVKHQGYRIELGEIEHALGRVAGVDEAVALHATRDGVSQIVAVVATSAPLVAEQVRKEVARLVPAYMVPSRVDLADRLPKNANGKIDRRLLKERYC